ncbi:MAG TPA: flagellar hook capping FlgD N-terminal domain-containing protein [Lachnospiraceae bacterium]|nr:flagellar hook capping FlgD N-terminal domain-containing protein [Lachnospiraceae bacterium]
MSLIAAYSDGQFVTQTASSESLSSKKEKDNSAIDSNAFLTLLVAEMQNQDPLEPTSNTEWISQYATFTQVSEIQSIGSDMSAMQAQGLVGEHVIMKVTGDDGETSYVTGKVDYVAYEEGKAYLSINNSLYSIDDLDTVASNEYMEAYKLADTVVEMINKLPNVDNLTLSDQANVEKVNDICSKMNDYQKTFLKKDIFDLVDSYYSKIQELKKAEEAADIDTKEDFTVEGDEEAEEDNTESDSTTD